MGQKQPKPPKGPRKPLPKQSDRRKAYLASDERKAGLLHMAAVKELPCVICGKPGPSDAHHVFHGRYGSRKASDFDVISLCKAHHQDGPDAIHNDKSGWLERYGPDHSYLPSVAAMLQEKSPAP